MTIEATPITSAGDAYISLDEADTYALGVADVSAWTAATDASKARALVQASDEIDAVRWAGLPYGDARDGYVGAQSRAFPRFVPDDPAEWPAGKIAETGTVWSVDGDGEVVVPEPVKLACFYQALAILRDPQRLARRRDRHDGIAGQSAGGASESYDTAAPIAMLCMEADRLLRKFRFKGGRVV